MDRRLGLGAAVCGLVVGALTMLAAPATAAADPAYQAPVVGQCFDMSAAELAESSYSEAAVDCGAPHTSQVIAVVQVPADVSYDGRDLAEFALQSCYPAERRVLGTSTRGVHLTAFDLGYFGPTAEQQAAGARWLRCDLVLAGGDELLPLPRSLEVGSFPFRKSVSRCLAGKDFHVTACTTTHTHRAAAALKVEQERYPSGKAWQRIGTERCRNAVSTRSYRFSWPSQVGWKVGDRTLVCYSQARR
jgi:hypothetical protein